eukprot:scaffold7344_cov145-Cylindrotheca_fusiformis.AAC.26
MTTEVSRGIEIATARCGWGIVSNARFVSPSIHEMGMGPARARPPSMPPAVLFLPVNTPHAVV